MGSSFFNTQSRARCFAAYAALTHFFISADSYSSRAGWAAWLISYSSMSG